ncbi:FxSxx-COOH system tetratricopeptide repeat protein [Streptomyces sanyensis]|uniref:FxSxx-COOH system tetratricopeptide repeat protein n=1 Tax=Streptomyces sanyensis TaxID=568869 RepID=A0ABP8ZW45_9ACTN
MAAGGNVGVAITGDGARVVTLPAEAADWARTIQAPPGAGNLPNSPSGVFVGRESELAELRRLLCAEGEAAVTQASGTRAIHGLGGIGKSTLALHYAHTHRHDYTLVWWITAQDTDQIIASLAALTTRLCPHWAATTGQSERAAWAILWLQWHPGWLLVFDNVEDPADLRHYLGTLTDGHHLATSRTATGWHAIAPTMPLGLLAPDAATTLLCTLALGEGHTPAPAQRRDTATLAAELGYLPLALEQAGAYLYETGTTLADYQDMLGQVMDTAAGGIDPERTIARIWRHTLTAIEQRNPQAITLLHAMAWLAPDDIPRTLLAPLCTTRPALGEALGVLHAYNMISHSPDRRHVNIHRLIQTVLRQQPSEPDAPPPGRHDAESLIQQAIPDDQTNTPDWEQLLPQALAVAESTPPHTPASTKTANAYEAVAQHLHRQGRDAHSIPLHEAALTQYEQVLGDTHPDTLQSRNNLACASRAAGDLERAIPLHETTLTQYEQVYGGTHPYTLNSRINLAAAYQEVGDLGRAILLLEATLPQYEEVLGDTHPYTLHSRNFLACAYQAVGDLERAIPLCEATLAQREEVLGDTHPDTLTSRNFLACAYQAVGDLERAIPLCEATLAQREEVLGDTHPDTLTSRNNLANAYQAVGDLERAIPLYEATLALCEESLGDTHPYTLGGRNNLANAYQAVGDLERAIPLYEATLAQHEEVLGDTHPHTLRCRNNLANARGAEAGIQQPDKTTPATAPDLRPSPDTPEQPV